MFSQRHAAPRVPSTAVLVVGTATGAAARVRNRPTPDPPCGQNRYARWVAGARRPRRAIAASPRRSAPPRWVRWDAHRDQPARSADGTVAADVEGAILEPMHRGALATQAGG